MTLLKMYSLRCSYVLRTYLLFPVFVIKKGNGKAEALCSGQNKGSS